MKAAMPLIASLNRTRDLVADRGYDAQYVIDIAQSRGALAHIPTQRDRKIQRSVDRNIYRQRNLVERFFNKLKYYRRIATRYDKLGSSFLAMVKLACIRLRLRHYESTA